jgi:hypothetical protein
VYNTKQKKIRKNGKGRKESDCFDVNGDQYGGIFNLRPSLVSNNLMKKNKQKQRPAFYLVIRCPRSPHAAATETAPMSTALYAGGRSNGSPSPEADLDGASLMLALLALIIPPFFREMFVVRIVRDRVIPCPGAGKMK